MPKCKGCKFEKYKLICLKCEQKKDRHTARVWPQQIRPVKRVHYDLTLREKIVWALVTASLETKTELGKYFNRHPSTIWRIYNRAREKINKI